MKKIRLFSILLTAILLLQCLCLPAEAADASVTDGCHSVDAAVPLSGTDKILDTAKAAILYDRRSDTMIYAYEPDRPVDPSSMAKLMTALIAVERADLKQYATVSHNALSSVGVGVASVKPRFKEGEELTIEDLLYCMMAASDNDAAAVIAETLAGSQANFVTWMNEKALEMGCTKTYFANVHGLYDPSAYTTARDICRILNTALDNDMFRALFTAKNYTVPKTNMTEERNVMTTNYMMSKEYSTRWFDDRVTGGKTGTDGAGGRCLAITAEDNEMELLAVVMGAEPVYADEEKLILDAYGSFEEMKALLDHASDGYTCCQVFYKGQTFSQYAVANGANHAVSTPESAVFAVLPKDYTQAQLRWIYGTENTNLTAPLEAGHLISYVEAWYGDICVAHTNLVAMHDVAVYQAPPAPSAAIVQEEDDGGAEIALVFGVIFGVAVVVALGMFLVRIIRNANARKRRRRRRRRTRR